MAIRASYVLVIFIIFSIFSCLSMYAASVFLGHVNPILPYINYTGDKPPESTIYTQLTVSIGCVLMLIIQIRFVQVFNYFKINNVTNLYNAANNASVFLGYIASFGLILSACFQETHAYVVHHLGGMVLFFLGSSLYILSQTIASYRMMALNDSAMMAYLRIALTALVMPTLMCYVAGYVIAVREFKKPWGARYFWGKEDGGWKYYITSSACQWTLIILFHAYIFTFYKDFKNVWITKTRIAVVVPAAEIEGSVPT